MIGKYLLKKMELLRKSTFVYRWREYYLHYTQIFSILLLTFNNSYWFQIISAQNENEIKVAIENQNEWRKLTRLMRIWNKTVVERKSLKYFHSK